MEYREGTLRFIITVPIGLKSSKISIESMEEYHLSLYDIYGIDYAIQYILKDKKYAVFDLNILKTNLEKINDFNSIKKLNSTMILI